MSVQAIIDSIFETAEVQVAEINAEAERKVQSLRTSTEHLVNEKRKKTLTVYETKIKQENEFARWRYEKTEFSKINETKSEILNDLEKQTLKVLLNKPKEFQIEILKKQLNSISHFKNVEITASLEHQPLLQKLISEYDGFILAKKNSEFSGGFLAKSKIAEVDASWQTMVSVSLDKNLPEVLEQLFPKK